MMQSNINGGNNVPINAGEGFPPVPAPPPQMPEPQLPTDHNDGGRGPASVLDPVIEAFEFYTVQLETTPTILLPGTPGEMKVWIGDENFAPTPTPGMASDEASVPASGQQSAIVNPWSNGFVFDPGKSNCFLLDRAGTTVRFTMTPNKAGIFRSGVDVNLYMSTDCSGTPTPREATVLDVTVTVNGKQLVLNHLSEIWEITWDGLLSVWKYAVGLLAAFIMALFRKKLAKLARKFGIKLPEKPPEK